MKIQRQEVSYRGNTPIESEAFTIKDVTLVAGLLSKMYPTPILAVVREYVCNALDSHIDAGKENTPITIISPSILHPYFEVHDEGVGMDDDQVRELWTSYGSTSKDKSNRLVGGFGIGSKAAFAYTKNFKVTTRKDGIQRIYNMYWGTNGPTREKMAEIPTDKPNGVEIQIPVERSNIYEFQKYIQSVCQWFDVLPNVRGLKLEPITKLLNTDNYCFIKPANNGYGWSIDTVYIKMGPIVYKTPQDVRIEGSDCPIILKKEIGDFQIAPDRESLILKDEDKQRIVKEANQYVQIETDKALNKVKKARTKWQAWVEWKKAGSDILTNVPFIWRGKQQGLWMPTERMLLKRRNCKPVLVTKQTIDYDSLVAIFDSEGKKTNYTKKITQWADENNIDLRNKKVLILVGNEKQRLKQWIRAGKPEVPYITYSDITAKKATKQSKPVKLTKYSQVKNCIVDFDIDFTSESKEKYIKTENSNFMNYCINPYFKDLVEVSGVTDDLLIIPKTYWKKIPKHWINLESHIKQSIDDFKSVAKQQMFEKIVNSGFIKGKIKRINWVPCINQNKYYKMLTNMSRGTSSFISFYHHPLLSTIQSKEFDKYDEKINDIINKILDDFGNRYPMVVNLYRASNTWNRSEKMKQDCLDYVNLINKGIDKYDPYVIYPKDCSVFLKT